jgi:hypothetical protein
MTNIFGERWGVCFVGENLCMEQFYQNLGTLSCQISI